MGFLLGLVTNLLSGYLQGPYAAIALVALFILVMLIYVVSELRNTIPIEVRFGHPTTLRREDRTYYARQGLVAFVSMYHPVHRSAQANVPEGEWLKAAQELRYDLLDLENSNLETTIHAVRTHGSALEHCWLIGTIGDTADRPGSSAYIPVLEEYLRREVGVRCEFHDGPKYHVAIDDDEQIYTKTYDVLQTVFREAEVCKLSPDNIVVDFTSGIRSMSLGAILASLDGKRDIEFVGTNYDAKGRIEPHRLFTMIFKFEAVLPRQ
jgi:hypothetical protein